MAFEPRPPRVFASRDALLASLRNQLFVAPGSAADGRLLAEMDRRVVVDGDDGSVRLSPVIDGREGIATWAPHPDALDQRAAE